MEGQASSGVDVVVVVVVDVFGHLRICCCLPPRLFRRPSREGDKAVMTLPHRAQLLINGQGKIDLT